MTETPKRAQYSEVLCNAGESAAPNLIAKSRLFWRAVPPPGVDLSISSDGFHFRWAARWRRSMFSIAVSVMSVGQAQQLIRVRILNACRISFRELLTTRDRLPRPADHRFVSGDFSTKLISWWHATDASRPRLRLGGPAGRRADRLWRLECRRSR